MSQTSTLPISAALHSESNASWHSNASASSSSSHIDASPSSSKPSPSSSPGLLSLQFNADKRRRPSGATSTLEPSAHVICPSNEDHRAFAKPHPSSSSGTPSPTGTKRSSPSSSTLVSPSSAKRQRLPSIEIGFGPEPPSLSSPSVSTTAPAGPKETYLQGLLKEFASRGYSTMNAHERERLLMSKLSSQFADFQSQLEASEKREKTLRSRAMVVLGQRDHALAKLAEAEEQLEVQRRGASGSSGVGPARNRQQHQTVPNHVTPLGMVTAMKAQWLPPRSLSASSLYGLP